MGGLHAEAFLYIKLRGLVAMLEGVDALRETAKLRRRRDRAYGVGRAAAVPVQSSGRSLDRYALLRVLGRYRRHCGD